MGSLKKRRKAKINKHKRRKRMKANRHKKRLRYKSSGDAWRGLSPFRCAQGRGMDPECRIRPFFRVWNRRGMVEG